jgi:hypothetical protein
VLGGTRDEGPETRGEHKGVSITRMSVPLRAEHRPHGTLCGAPEMRIGTRKPDPLKANNNLACGSVSLLFAKTYIHRVRASPSSIRVPWLPLSCCHRRSAR